MARPLRYEAPGAIYHVMARGEGGKDVFEGDSDRRGHVFQGRYNAVVVNGEGSGVYFRIVADYIHLNPVRSGWVGGTSGRKLDEWKWSSYPQYAGRSGFPW